MGKRAYLEKKKKFFLRKRALTNKEEKNTKQSIFKNQVLEGIGSLEKLPIVQQERTIASVGHAEK